MKNARAQGRFDDVKGRGKPIVTSNDEKNPFIGREEFLMNRIVQRNGAAPPWVELRAGEPELLLTFRSLFLKRPDRNGVFHRFV